MSYFSSIAFSFLFFSESKRITKSKWMHEYKNYDERYWHFRQLIKIKWKHSGETIQSEPIRLCRKAAQARKSSSQKQSVCGKVRHAQFDLGGRVLLTRLLPVSHEKYNQMSVLGKKARADTWTHFTFDIKENETLSKSWSNSHW